jgi:hypothetical protein
MSLTIATHELYSESAHDVPPAVDKHTVTGPPTVERWLEVMYSTRPDARLRARFVPITQHYEGDVAKWLQAMWGIRPGAGFPTSAGRRLSRETAIEK